MPRYKIIRMYFDEKIENQTIKRHMTLEEAQAWCRNPETSSSTATSRQAVRLTERAGPWFEGYEEE